MKRLPVCLLLWALALPLPSLRADFGFDELEIIQASEQEELLELAEKAASGNDFAQAGELIQQARQKGYAPGKIKKAEKFVAARKTAYEAEQARIAREEEEKRLAEERRRRQRYNASGNMGGALNCDAVARDFGLWRYCTEGTCDGLAADNDLWLLCAQNDVNAVSDNYAVWRYLKDGEALFSDINAYEAARQNAGSFADRKRFVIYYLRGYIYRRY